MRTGRLYLACVLVVTGLAACRSAPPVLPPVPAASGLVLTKPAEVVEMRDGQVLVDRIVAVVNDEAITMSELQESVVLYQREQRVPADSDVAAIQRRVLDLMINRRLQVQEARREKVEVTEDDVRAMLDDVVRQNGGDRGKLEAQLRQDGLSWDGLRREVRDQILARRISSRRVRQRASATESEVDAYLAANRAKLETGLRYHARHIAVLAEPPDQPGAWERARAEIEAVVARVREGADFAALARELSRDASAAAGGDLGWLARGELEAAFEEPILHLAKGELTAPIKSGAGYHLFRLEEREELTAQMLGDARQQARDLLLQRKVQERMDEWVEGLRRRALIAVRL